MLVVIKDQPEPEPDSASGRAKVWAYVPDSLWFHDVGHGWVAEEEGASNVQMNVVGAVM